MMSILDSTSETPILDAIQTAVNEINILETELETDDVESQINPKTSKSQSA